MLVFVLSDGSSNAMFSLECWLLNDLNYWCAIIYKLDFDGGESSDFRKPNNVKII